MSPTLLGLKEARDEIAGAFFEGLALDPEEYVTKLLSPTFVEKIKNPNSYVYVHRGAIKKDEVQVLRENAHEVEHLNVDVLDFAGKVYLYQPKDAPVEFHFVGLSGEDWYRQTLYMLAVLDLSEERFQEEGIFNPHALLESEVLETLQQYDFDTVSICSIGQVEIAIEQVLHQRKEQQYKQAVIEKLWETLNQLQQESDPAILIDKMKATLEKLGRRFQDKVELIKRIIANHSETERQLELICSEEQLQRSPIARQIATVKNLDNVGRCIKRLSEITSADQDAIVQFEQIKAESLFQFGTLRNLIRQAEQVPRLTEKEYKVVVCRRDVLSHHIVEVLGKKHLLMSIMGTHGDLSGHVTAYVLQNQPHIVRVNLYGSTGSLTKELGLNSLVLPHKTIISIEADRPKPAPLQNLANLNAKQVQHGNVSTLLREHQANIRWLQKKGVHTIDMEAYHMARAVNEATDKGKVVELRIVLRVSDIVTSKEFGAQRDRFFDQTVDLSHNLQEMVIDFGLVY